MIEDNLTDFLIDNTYKIRINFEGGQHRIGYLFCLDELDLDNEVSELCRQYKKKYNMIATSYSAIINNKIYKIKVLNGLH